MPNAASKTSHNVAKHAVTTEKLLLADRESISLLFVPTAETKQKFRSSPKPTDLFTAVTASQNQEKSKSRSTRNVTDY